MISLKIEQTDSNQFEIIWVISDKIEKIKILNRTLTLSDLNRFTLPGYPGTFPL